MNSLDKARERLATERQQTLQRLDRLTHDFDTIVAASRDTNADDEHDPEGATIAFERSQIAALARRARDRLDEIDAALTRADRGTYGICQRCGLPIPEGRLAARPTALTCIHCARG